MYYFLISSCTLIFFFFFFFSSRRRHTRCSRDWSSDVCSSDLAEGRPIQVELRSLPTRFKPAPAAKPPLPALGLCPPRDGESLLACLRHSPRPSSLHAPDHSGAAAVRATA